MSENGYGPVLAEGFFNEGPLGLALAAVLVALVALVRRVRRPPTTNKALF